MIRSSSDDASSVEIERKLSLSRSVCEEGGLFTDRPLGAQREDEVRVKLDSTGGKQRRSQNSKTFCMQGRHSFLDNILSVESLETRKQMWSYSCVALNVVYGIAAAAHVLNTFLWCALLQLLHINQRAAL